MTPAFSPSSRLLVFAPHPDDESLACGILLQCSRRDVAHDLGCPSAVGRDEEQTESRKNSTRARPEALSDCVSKTDAGYCRQCNWQNGVARVVAEQNVCRQDDDHRKPRRITGRKWAAFYDNVVMTGLEELERRQRILDGVRWDVEV